MIWFRHKDSLHVPPKNTFFISIIPLCALQWLHALRVSGEYLFRQQIVASSSCERPQVVSPVTAVLYINFRFLTYDFWLCFRRLVGIWECCNHWKRSIQAEHIAVAPLKRCIVVHGAFSPSFTSMSSSTDPGSAIISRALPESCTTTDL